MVEPKNHEEAMAEMLIIYKENCEKMEQMKKKIEEEKREEEKREDEKKGDEKKEDKEQESH